MLVTIKGEPIPGREEGHEAALTPNAPAPKIAVSAVRGADAWIYVLVAGLFAVIAITVGMSY